MLLVLLCLDYFIQHYVFKVDSRDVIAFPFYRYGYRPLLYRGVVQGTKLSTQKAGLERC